MRVAILLFFGTTFGFTPLTGLSQGVIHFRSNQTLTVDAIFEEIEAQTPYHFIYRSDLFEDAPVVRVRKGRINVEELLKKSLADLPISFEVDGSDILLSRVPVADSRSIAEQDRTITGTITDEDGVPLPGVNITEEGTSRGTTTDFDGKYEIAVTTEQSVLRFSIVGFEDQTIATEGRNSIDVILKVASSELDEVVVIGYGTQKKRDITGSVSSVKVDDIESSRITSLDGMLKGTPGINVVQNNGAPGASFSINIRGASSVSAGNDPLYVIDGFPVDNQPALDSGGEPGFSGSRSPTNPMASINPSDIESIEVLKDASASAIYGSRGANGVIMITTKKGAQGKVKMDFQSSIGFQTPFNRMNLLSAQDYKRVLNEIVDEGGGSEEERVGEISNNGAGVDWQRAITHNSALMQNYQLGFSGGTESSQFYLSLSHTNQEGIVQSTGYKRYGVRFNLNSQVTDKFKIGFNSTASYSTNNLIQNGFETNENAGPLYAAANFDPTLDIRNEDGSFITSPLLSIDNPLALINGATGSSWANRVLASVTGEYTVFDDLLLKLNLGSDIVNEKRKNYIDRLTKNGRNMGGIAGAYQGDRMSYLAELTLNYNKTFTSGHSFNVLAGGTFQRFTWSKMNGHANDFPSDATRADNLSLGSQDTYSINNPSSAHRLASLIGRINYSFKGLYSATLTARRDGSSRFGENNKYGTFPSAALAWTVSEEGFFKDRTPFNFLKLRMSWGITGNQDVADFAYQTTYSGSDPAVWDDQLITSTAPQRLPNPDLKWEQTEQIDVGLEFALWRNRISGGVDFYRKITKDMLLNLPIPESTGFSTVLTNVGKIQNSGLDIFLHANIIEAKDFQWSSDLTLTTLRNKVISLGGIPDINAGSDFLHVPQVGIIKPGEALNSFYGWEVEGVWQENDDFSLTDDNVSPGSLKYVDQNGDGVVDGNDRVVLGNSFPSLQWSFSNTFKYKNFELFMYFDGVKGAQMLNGNLIESYFPINFRRNKFSEPYLNRWTPENPTNKYPSFVDPLAQGRKTVNSRTVQSADYFRLRNIRISYNIPESVTWFPTGQVYFSVDNLFIISPYGGIDPTINPNNNASLRVDFNSYPTSRTYSMGFRLNL